jgi:hypothetical protein
MTLNSQRCLIIPDVHQNTAWVERIFARETTHDRVVFLGDYFDSHLPPRLRTSVSDTCAFLDRMRLKLGDRVVFLLGNHDIQYLEAKPACDRHRTPRNLNYQCGAAFIHSAAKRIAKDLSPEFWQNARLFVEVNGHLLSHAGVAPALWPVRATFADSLATLDQACATALRTLPVKSSPLLRAGEVRGGDQAIGGITWQDWDYEFADSLPCPQIVGHTASPEGARQNGRSWCLDGHQTTYGVLTPDGLRVETC